MSSDNDNNGGGGGDDEEYVVLGRLKRSALLGSNLYSSLLASIAISLTSVSSLSSTSPMLPTPPMSLTSPILPLSLSLSCRQQQQEQLLPVPDCLDDEVIVDYISCVDKELRVKYISKTLKACSLIDDKQYLNHCTKRFLTYYDDCKHVLLELNPYLLEQVYLRMPKDLVPEHLQDSNAFLAKWIGTYHGGNSNYFYTVSFDVADYTYKYSLAERSGGAKTANYIEVSCEIGSNEGGAGAVYRELKWNGKTAIRLHELAYKVNSHQRRVLTCERWWDDNGQLLSVKRFNADFYATNNIAVQPDFVIVRRDNDKGCVLNIGYKADIEMFILEDYKSSSTLTVDFYAHQP